MIVVSEDVVLSQPLSETGDENENSPLIGWHNLVTISNVSADRSDALYPAINLANPATNLKWQGLDGGDHVISMFTDYNEDVDYVAIARHNLGSRGFAVTVEGRVGAGAWSELVGSIVLPDDTPTIFRFAPQLLTEIRLRIEDGVDPYLPPAIAVLYVGKLLVLQRRMYVGHSPITLGSHVTVVNGTSERGEFLGRLVIGESKSTSVALQNLTPDWYRQKMDPFVKASAESPFFFAWRPGKYPREVGYAWRDSGDLAPSNALSNGMMQVSFSMSGVT